MTDESIITCILKHFPNTEAIYLFGSYATPHENSNSDIDIALLLPVQLAKTTQNLSMSNLRFELEDLSHKIIDLINLRQVSTVLQKEVIFSERRIFTQNNLEADQFEMLTISFYQKLNEERHHILQAFKKTGRAYEI